MTWRDTLWRLIGVIHLEVIARPPVIVIDVDRSSRLRVPRCHAVVHRDRLRRPGLCALDFECFERGVSNNRLLDWLARVAGQLRGRYADADLIAKMTILDHQRAGWPPRLRCLVIEERTGHTDAHALDVRVPDGDASRHVVGDQYAGGLLAGCASSEGSPSTVSLSRSAFRVELPKSRAATDATR